MIVTITNYRNAVVQDTTYERAMAGAIPVSVRWEC